MPKLATQDTQNSLTSQGILGNISYIGLQSAKRKKTATNDSWKLMLSSSVGAINRIMMALKAKGCKGSVSYSIKEKMVKILSIKAALTSETGIPATKA